MKAPYPVTMVRCPGRRIGKRASSMAANWASLVRPWLMVRTTYLVALARCPGRRIARRASPGRLDVLGEAVVDGELHVPGDADVMPRKPRERQASSTASTWSFPVKPWLTVSSTY